MLVSTDWGKKKKTGMENNAFIHNKKYSFFTLTSLRQLLIRFYQRTESYERKIIHNIGSSLVLHQRHTNNYVVSRNFESVSRLLLLESQFLSH